MEDVLYSTHFTHF